MTELNTHPLRADMLLAMRRLARSVAVISCSDGERRYSMSATAVDSLSTEPPSLLICVNRNSSIFPPLDKGAAFGVNVLSAQHQHIAIDCSGRLKGEDRFSTGDWQRSAQGVPFLLDAQASLICEQDGRFDYGTHAIFIGRVEQVLISGEVDPLVYVDGAYTTATPPVRCAAA
ncbi:flavin reductase family protein [Paraburkholderia sp. D15]|uniref:flavin reductase family protein n=1 Tax=Paraburkholderia sp. D15 TaxID=2880218 RepID=UPI00247B150B|nr:flavin reductase family protein [Paraburkholderia sp. D15]WGS54034.1 flavin reductase family protein [Paraburkholderia sp. D15]WKF60431.1 4-hydroxyphenylacetate 3-monooxygenase reductase component [Paraburkholderia busanensis]